MALITSDILKSLLSVITIVVQAQDWSFLTIQGVNNELQPRIVTIAP